MPDHTSRFNVVSQLSETMLDSIIREQQESGDFPSRWQGSEPLNAAPLGMVLTFSYDMTLGVPGVSTLEGDTGKLTLAVDIKGLLQLDAEIGARPPVGASSHVIPVKFRGSVTADVPLLVARIGTYAYLELATRVLQTVALQVQYDTDVGGNGPIFTRMIQRIVLAQLYDLNSIPISHAFEIVTTTGWKITNYTIRIIGGPSPPDRDDVTIALNTWPNRDRGIRAGLSDFVNPGFDFAICYDERFLVQALSEALADDRIPKEYDENGCPLPGGPVQVQDITINLNDGYIYLFIDATLNGGTFDCEGRLTLDVAPGPILQVKVNADPGPFAFLSGLSAVLARALFAVANLETFADPTVPDRPAACRVLVFPPALCGTDLSLVLNAPVPKTKVKLGYEIERIDVSANELSTLGHIVTTHS